MFHGKDILVFSPIIILESGYLPWQICFDWLIIRATCGRASLALGFTMCTAVHVVTSYDWFRLSKVRVCLRGRLVRGKRVYIYSVSLNIDVNTSVALLINQVNYLQYICHKYIYCWQKWFDTLSHRRYLGMIEPMSKIGYFRQRFKS